MSAAIVGWAHTPFGKQDAETVESLIVRVATDAPVALSTPSDALPLTAKDPAKVADLAAAYGVTSSISRLQTALDRLPG